MDEIGIPVFDEPPRHVSSPIIIKKNQSENRMPALTSPVNSPYENIYFKNNVYGNLKPKSPNTQSPRTRIKTSFAHKNVNSPQYFIFPTPPPVEDTKQPNFEVNVQIQENHNISVNNTKEKVGIEKQLSLEEEIPMIDDIGQPNDIEFRYSKIINEKDVKDIPIDNLTEKETELTKDKSFDDVKKELMADIPELEEFEKDLQKNKRDKFIKNISGDIERVDIEGDSIDSAILDIDSSDELKTKFEKLKEERKKVVVEIHDIKCKMSEIRLQEDDVLREVSIYYHFKTMGLLFIYPFFT